MMNTLDMLNMLNLFVGCVCQCDIVESTLHIHIQQTTHQSNQLTTNQTTHNNNLNTTNTNYTLTLSIHNMQHNNKDAPHKHNVFV